VKVNFGPDVGSGDHDGSTDEDRRDCAIAKAAVAVGISDSGGVVLDVAVEVEALGIAETGVGHGGGLGRPVRRHEPPHRR